MEELENDTPNMDTADTGAAEGATPESAASTLSDKVVGVLRTCYDPEIPVDIYELGLIYDVDVGDDGAVAIRMTLTSPACPVAGTLPPEVEHKVAALEEVSSAKVELVWEPPWTPEKMTEAAKLQLGMF